MATPWLKPIGMAQPGFGWRWLFLGLLLLPTGCQLARSEPQTPTTVTAEAPVAVETAVVKTGTVEEVLAYTGTTRPAQQVSLRSQVSGQLQAITVDAGDPVTQGTVLAQVNDRLLRVAVNEAQAELASRRSEVAQAQAEVSNGQTTLEAAKVRFQQAQTEAERLQQLAAAGAISDQEAEQAQLTLAVAQQALRSAEEGIRTRQQAVSAAQGQVASQQAVVAQEQEQLSFTSVRSPLTGVVLQKALEAGDYVQPGTEILQIGDLRTIEVTVQVSELDLSRISRGQPVQVRLDAFPDQVFSGRVTRMTPVANPTSRQLPVEVTLDNSDGRVGSGLLARVQFTESGGDPIVVPQSAVQEGAGGFQVFVVDTTAAGKIAQVRTVTLGRQANDRVEIRSGLAAGETLVVASDRPLSPGQSVRTSILSE